MAYHRHKRFRLLAFSGRTGYNDSSPGGRARHGCEWAGRANE